MTVGEMLGWTNRLKDIEQMKEPQRSIRLGVMMSDMEGAYSIPALRNEAFEKKNPFVMELYRTVSSERSL